MQHTVQWVTTTQHHPWQQQDALTFGPVQGMPGVIVLPNQVHQTIVGLAHASMSSATTHCRCWMMRREWASCASFLRQASAPTSRSAACPSVQMIFRGIDIRMPRRPVISSWLRFRSHTTRRRSSLFSKTHCMYNHSSESGPRRGVRQPG